jgi:hypothetical protein
MGIPRQVHAERLEALGGPRQQWHGFTSVLLLQGDLPAQMINLGDIT